MTLVIAHRGASAYELENTLAAFRTAIAMQADGIEFDVHVTADGVPVVHHDPVVGPHTIQHTLFDTLRSIELPNGESMPSLQEALDMMVPEVTAYVEVKALAEAHDGAVLDTLATSPAPENCQVHSFDHRIVHRLRLANPDLKCGVLSSSYPIRPLVPLLDAGAAVLWQQESLIDKALVSEAHALGLQVVGWTVDDPERMRTLLDMGLDGICTNRPDVAREAIG